MRTAEMEQLPKDYVEASEFCTKCWKWQLENNKILPSFKTFIFIQAKPYRLTDSCDKAFEAIQHAMANPDELEDVPEDGSLVPEPAPRKRRPRRSKKVPAVEPPASKKKPKSKNKGKGQSAFSGVHVF